MTETESSGPDARRAEAIFQPEGGQGEGIAMKDVKLLAQNLRIYGYLLSTSFRQRMAYRAGVWMEILHGGLFVFLQGSLWTALIATGYADASLQEMITYVIINSLVGYLTAFNATSVISQRVDDGSIASDLILPIRFKWRYFLKTWEEICSTSCSPASSPWWLPFCCIGRQVRPARSAWRVFSCPFSLASSSPTISCICLQ